MTSFIGFLQLVRTDYTSDEQIIIACPSQEQIAVTITSLQLQPKTPRSSVSRQRSETPMEEDEEIKMKIDAEVKPGEVKPAEETKATNGDVSVEKPSVESQEQVSVMKSAPPPGVEIQDQISLAKPVAVPKMA